VKQLPLPKAKKGQRRYVNRPDPRRGKVTTTAGVPGLELFEQPIPVPEVSEPAHPLVTGTRRAVEGAESDEYGIMRPSGEGVLDVGVSAASLDRALRIMNAVINALEGAGFDVGVDPILDSAGRPRGYETVAVIHDQRIPFSLTEKTEQEERPPTDEERAEMRRSRWSMGPFHTYRSTGELSLRINEKWPRGRHRRTWSDAKNRSLEDCLHSFVRSLLLSAEASRSGI
jgi:hypothetical protein